MSEPNLLIDDEPDIALDEPEISLDEPTTPAVAAVAASEPAADEPRGLVEVLPVGFQLPKLIRFVPNAALKRAADEAVKYALSIDVAGPEQLVRADAAVTAVRAAQAAITEHFREPAALSDEVHKSITGKRAEWLGPGNNAIALVGKRIATEQLRLKRQAEDERRRQQEEEDRKARERARQQAVEAERAKAPAPVVEQMKKDAETVTAPPVPTTATEPPKLSGQTVVKTWKARIVGTPADAEPLPSTAELNALQQLEVLKLLKAIIDGRAPIACIEISESYVNNRAKSEKATFSIPGLEAFEDLGVRAKAARRQR